MNRRRLLGGAIALSASWLPAMGKTRGEDAVPMDEVLAAAPPLGDVSTGSADAPVVVVEYTSLLCPYCGAFRRGAWEGIKRDYVEKGKVRWIFREFSIGNADFVAFALGRCAGNAEAGRIAEELFGRQRDVFAANKSSEAFVSFAKTIGFDRDRLSGCMADKSFAESVEASRRDAEEKFEVDGTPTFFLPGRRIVGLTPASEFRGALDAALAGAGR